MERCTLFKFVDEIDHYTVKCANREITDRETAVKMIFKYCAVDEAVEAAFKFSPSELEEACANDIYEILITIRNKLLDEAFGNT
ncbi:MAG: hypothetical protein GX051_00140 [Clostridiales bacterium]|nr:hypothetical protein [Clostridiales bacterium]